jgi:UDP-2,3-diacylglucosamine pyrophosphatase LpxH
MSICDTPIAADALALPRPGLLSRRPMQTPKGLDAVLANAPRLSFDDASRFVFFSDCHRGDNSRADAFAQNEELYLAALGRYRRRGYTYVEVGDGDDLWLNGKLESVRAAHPRVFDLLHEFDREGRLHLIRGNHDQGGDREADKDGLPTYDGLVLEHVHSQQRVFVVHGHQLDLPNAALGAVSRLLVKNVWSHLARSRAGRRFRPTGTGEPPAGALGAAMNWIHAQRRKVALQLAAWAQAQRLITICAHTHRPVCANYGQAPYFNTGSCIAPGYVTGIELERGVISLVKWTLSAFPGGNGLRAERQLLAAPRAMCLFP